MSARWSAPDDIAAKVRRRWTDGSLLRAYADGDPFPAIDVPLRGPKAAEIGDDLDAARSWAARLDAGQRSGTRYDELREVRLAPTMAVVVENEISYLSVDVPPGGVVIWGKGFEVDRVGQLPWLADVNVAYWGDLDTHGFAILDRLRAWLPQTRSVMMDRETLLAHRDRWVSEDRPTSARLPRLLADEQSLYDDIASDRLSVKVRLEQERIDWSWARSHLARTTGRHVDP